MLIVLLVQRRRGTAGAIRAGREAGGRVRVRAAARRMQLTVLVVAVRGDRRNRRVASARVRTRHRSGLLGAAVAGAHLGTTRRAVVARARNQMIHFALCMVRMMQRRRGAALGGLLVLGGQHRGVATVHVVVVAVGTVHEAVRQSVGQAVVHCRLMCS